MTRKEWTEHRARELAGDDADEIDLELWRGVARAELKAADMATRNPLTAATGVAMARRIARKSKLYNGR